MRLKPGKDFIGVGCGALIVNDNNETLLLLRSKNCKNEAGYWTKPGGSIEFGETVEEAIKREIKEELGIDIELFDYLGHVDHLIPSEAQHWISISYVARIISGEPINTEPHKHEEIRWFKISELPEKMTQTTWEPVSVYLKMKEAK